MLTITSPQNKLIKEIINLQGKSRERKKNKKIIIEGKKELSLAVGAGVEIEKVLFCPDIITIDEVKNIIKEQISFTDIYEVSEAVFSKISYRETTGGIVVLAKMPEKKITDLTINDQSVFIILESVEKPGNLGAICRVADAAKVDGLIICDPLTDIYNPNSIRSSLGCVFTVDIISSDFDETINWLKENKIKSYAAELTAAEFYQNMNLAGKVALIFGTEATGLTEKWIKYAEKRIKIPMRGVIDSLNVTTSVAILVFEAMRQRNFK
ncbi:MAG: RNA methyltransferase [Bacteroidales bacterium]|jgi:TrmH family RNA methyltransferase|nr:RNA methyltransferase [Bacteroidales bacterium]